MIRKSCPHCAKPIDIELTWYDDEDDEPGGVELTRGPWWEPCTAREAPSAYGVRAPYIGYVLGPHVTGGAVCSWLGPTCNIASHVTPVTPGVALRPGDAVSASFHLFGRDGSKSCSYVNSSLALDRVWLAPGLARCVQYIPE